MTVAGGSPQPAIDSSRMPLLSSCDIGGRPDSLQIMLWRGHAFVSHPFSGGFSVVDVRDPRQPRPVAYVPPPPGTRTLHLQLSDGILLVTNEADNSASEKYLDKAQYFGTQLGQDTDGIGAYSGSAGVRRVGTRAAGGDRLPAHSRLRRAPAVVGRR
jgi:hypothetical protein